MCNFCEKSQRLDTEWDCLRIQIVDNNLEIGYDAYSTDSSFGTEVKINYCMMCGKKLTQKKETSV